MLSQEVQAEQRRALRLAWSGVGTLILFLALAGWQWRNRRSAASTRRTGTFPARRHRDSERPRCFDLAQKFRDKGLPRRGRRRHPRTAARRLETQLRESRREASNSLSRTQAAALDEKRKDVAPPGKDRGRARRCETSQRHRSGARRCESRRCRLPGRFVGDWTMSSEIVKRARKATLPARWNPIATVSRSPTGWQNPTAATVAGGKRCSGGVRKGRRRAGRARGRCRRPEGLRRQPDGRAKGLAATGPEQPVWLRCDLSALHSRIGDLQQRRGEPRGGDTVLPGEPRDQRPLGEIRSRRYAGSARLLEVAHHNGRRHACGLRGGPCWRVSIRSRQCGDCCATCGFDPNNSLWQSDLALSEDKMGDIERGQRDPRQPPPPPTATPFAIRELFGESRSRPTLSGSAICRCRTRRSATLRSLLRATCPAR